MAKKLIIAVSVVGALAIGFISFAILWPVKSTLSNTNSGHAGSLELAEYSTRLSDCIACHSVPNGKPFAGGLAMGTPLGTIYATNITPDPKTGIGTYDLVDFDNALRHGIAKDGHRLYPAMPYPSYAKLTDADVKSLYDFFMHQVPAVHHPNKRDEIPAYLNFRWPLAAWDMIFARSGPFQPNPNHDANWN